jgi:hypothetical protein
MGSGSSRRYTSGMKLAILLSRHRRLLALCGLSAAAHLLVLELSARRISAPPAAPPVGEALRLRLVQAGPRAATPADMAPSPAAAARASRRKEQAPTEHARTEPARTEPARKTAPTPDAAHDSAAAAAPAPAPPESAGAPLVQMPGRYRVRMPDPVRLSYALTRQAPTAAAASAAATEGGATIDWRSDGDHYSLAVDGVLGRLGSEGRSGDAGIVPRRAFDERGGAQLVTEFDLDGGRILFHASGASVPGAIGAQDRASVLMQLAGIGLGEPDQIAGQRDDDLQIVVAGADGAEIARYRVMGQEAVQTALGSVQAWRLAQVTPVGQERLELWLAPERGWLPVQIRLTRPDGSAATQTLTRIEPGLSK